MPFDQTSDPNLSALHRYSKLYGLPDFVKSASAAAVYTPEEKKSRLFANPKNLEFPIHTKAATYVSRMFFINNRHELPEFMRERIDENLQKAAKYWGITKEIEQLEAKHAALHQEDSTPDSDYALVWAGDDGAKNRQYPLRNGLETKAAADWFAKYLPDLRNAYTFMDRQVIATKILDKAAEHSVLLGEDTQLVLERSAGQGTCDQKKVAECIRNRAICTGVDGDIRRQMQKLADAVERTSRAFMDPESLSNLAQTIDQFDRNHGLFGKYGSLIPSPEDAVFALTFSKLADLRETVCESVIGSIYCTEQFDKLAVTSIAEAFGDDIAEQVCTGLRIDPQKMAALVATLPRPDAVAFDAFMDAQGLSAMRKTSSGVGFTHEELLAMAGN